MSTRRQSSQHKAVFGLALLALLTMIIFMNGDLVVPPILISQIENSVNIYDQSHPDLEVTEKSEAEILDEFSPEEVADGSLKNRSQDDPKLLNHIKTHYLFPPSDGDYNLTPVDITVNKRYRNQVVPHVLKLLNKTKTGFFVECGANDGEYLSNSLFLELEGWTGLLIESDPTAFKILQERNRKAWIANACLSTLPYPKKTDVILDKNRTFGQTLKPGSYLQSRFPISFTSQCFPLFSMLSALSVETIDYLSLDNRGAELAILKTFPFDGPMLIKVISIENNAGMSPPPPDGMDLKTFMKSKGYEMSAFIDDPQRGWVHDYIFVHESVLHQAEEDISQEVTTSEKPQENAASTDDEEEESTTKG